MHADDFRQNSVAIATVCVADDRQCCTLTLCVVARRSVHRLRESSHVDVNCARKTAHALDFRTRPYHSDLKDRARVANGQRGAIRRGVQAPPDANGAALQLELQLSIDHAQLEEEEAHKESYKTRPRHPTQAAPESAEPALRSLIAPVELC